MFTINIKRKALRKLEQLNPKQKQNIHEITLILKNDPIPYRKTDICKLQGHKDTYRIRTGNLRIIYQIQWNQKTILINHIAPREKAYK